MAETANVTSFIREVRQLVNELAAYGTTEKPSDGRIAAQVLSALPSRFDTLVSILSNETATPTLEQLAGRLQLEADRMKSKEEPMEGDALLLRIRKQILDRRQFRRGYPGSSSNSTSQHRYQRNTAFVHSPRNTPCNSCGQLGHWYRACPTREDKVSSDQRQMLLAASDLPGQQNYGDLHPSDNLPPNAEEDFVQEFEAALAALAVEDNDDSWYVDSGASTHVTGNSNQLQNFQKVTTGSTVRSAGGQKHAIEGKGTASIQNSTGIKRFDNVYYVPGLTKSLLSVGSLTDDDHIAIFDRDKCLIVSKHNPQQLVASATREKKGGLYRLDLQPQVEEFSVNLAQITPTALENARLWHKRLGHLSFSAVHHLSAKQLGKGLPYIPHIEELCASCQYGKQSREAYPSQSSSRAAAILDVVHSDIGGPLSFTSMGGGRYFITFTDDFSRRTWLYILKSKGEAFSMFARFKALVEKQTGRFIKTLRTDRGGEYMSKAFQAFCHKEGIARQLTVAYSPAQNGVAERKNRTLLERARSMAKSCNLPTYLWAECLTAANHLVNLSPTRANSGISPEHKYTGTVPDLSHLRASGCEVFAHVGSHGRNKLDDRALRCILVGYDNESKAYRCYCPSNRKVLVSRDVRFNENSDSSGTTLSPTTTQDISGISMFDLPDLCPPPNALDSTTIVTHDTAPRESLQTADDSTAAQGHTLPHPPVVNTGPRRSTRASIRPKYLHDYIGAVTNEIPAEPTSYAEASQYKEWIQAMDNEMSSIAKNDTWKLVRLPPGHTPITAKWVYRVKEVTNGTGPIFKARIVARGFQQQPGIDYDEIFAPVAKWNSLRLLVALAAKKDWKLHHLDVKTTFLNGELQEQKILSQAGMTQCTSSVIPMDPNVSLIREPPGENLADASSYRSTVGQLLYLTHSRPDIAFAVGRLSQFMSKPFVSHAMAMKRLLRYLHGTADFGLMFSRTGSCNLHGYTDADRAGDADTRRSTTGYLFQLGRSSVTWVSRKQTTVATSSTSSTEAEYRAMSEGCKEAMWLRQISTDLGLSTQHPLPLHCVNASSLKIARNPVYHGRTKHIGVHHHFVRKQVQDGTIDLIYTPTREQIADIFTKSLGRQQFLMLRDKLGVISISTATKLKGVSPSLDTV
ncbi:hypothetical protein R1sor_008970 [Riccia sorocarpa]|uniref:Polyprotein n=1 Tax=Riccia sorocarpa TaxID=122646 RepID=A0ABD3H8G2_9MARC